ncbi:hypothetical protein K488DRAFT_52506 [Vararia minispora EC-137]|uniref:Uncharacterized protein n=1 Tax=Vararia minispora EC-137 TaxID=1314806 RepID=A0ACB8QHX3_9AGAM|nr:hypothetical protein K488DRAFT_52506 [Vararia minispora EC-137]
MRHHFSHLPQQPLYTCPTCRVIVTRAPVECFAIKAIVDTVGKLLGESDPCASSPPPKTTRHGKGRAPPLPPVGRLWDGFFGRR